MKNLLKIMAFFSLIAMNLSGQADTILNYMTIANNIPTMSMKPDEQSQGWVRSAQRMLTLTDETLAQTVVAMNTVAAKQGHPIFCFPQGVLFDANTVHDIILKTYAELAKTQAALISTMPISDVLMLGMVSRYSCSPMPAATPTDSSQLAAAVSVGGGAQPAPAPATPSPAPTAAAPALPASSSIGASLPAMPTNDQIGMANNPYGTPPTQQVVSADTPPPL
jgi:hypothetical protein